MKLGVRVETGARIPRSPTGGYDPSHADADIVYDCTGSRPATRWASAPGSAVAVDQDGYVLVKPTLGIASQTQPTIFALGDCADTGEHGVARPALAQGACQRATRASRLPQFLRASRACVPADHAWLRACGGGRGMKKLEGPTGGSGTST